MSKKIKKIVMNDLPNNLTQSYIANEIGNYFDHNTNETARLLAHAALGAASAYISGNSATSGALGAASGEAIAILVRKELYGDKSSSQLTQQEKETIRAVATLASGLVGAASGGSFEDSATSAAAGYNAAVNNYLSPKQIEQRSKDIANCNGSLSCEIQEKTKWDIISTYQDMSSIGDGDVNIWNGLSDGIPQMWENSPWYAKGTLVPAGAITVLPVAEYGVSYAYMNPVLAAEILFAADGYYGGGSPGYNWGSFVSGFENFTGIQIVPNWIKP